MYEYSERRDIFMLNVLYISIIFIYFRVGAWRHDHCSTLISYLDFGFCMFTFPYFKIIFIYLFFILMAKCLCSQHGYCVPKLFSDFWRK